VAAAQQTRPTRAAQERATKVSQVAQVRRAAAIPQVAVAVVPVRSAFKATCRDTQAQAAQVSHQASRVWRSLAAAAAVAAATTPQIGAAQAARVAAAQAQE
jgi:hypothetical protein